MKITFSAGFKNYSTKDRWAYSKLCRSEYAKVLFRMTVCTHLSCVLLQQLCVQRVTWAPFKTVCPRKSNNVREERIIPYIILCFSYSLPKQAHLATSWLLLPALNVVCGLQGIKRYEGTGTGKINKNTQRGSNCSRHWWPCIWINGYKRWKGVL